MNRRTLLRATGVAASVTLAGCIDGVREHFQGSLQGVIPLNVHSEAEYHYDVHIEAYERGTDRQTYEEGITVTPNQNAVLEHLSATEQDLRVTKYDSEDQERLDVQEATVTPNTREIVIVVSDDGIEIDIERDDGDGGGGDSVGPGETIDDPEELEEYRDENRSADDEPSGDD